MGEGCQARKEMKTLFFNQIRGRDLSYASKCSAISSTGRAVMQVSFTAEGALLRPYEGAGKKKKRAGAPEIPTPNSPKECKAAIKLCESFA